jgi:hypothetical protein
MTPEGSVDAACLFAFLAMYSPCSHAYAQHAHYAANHHAMLYCFETSFYRAARLA